MADTTTLLSSHVTVCGSCGGYISGIAPYGSSACRCQWRIDAREENKTLRRRVAALERQIAELERRLRGGGYATQ